MLSSGVTVTAMTRKVCGKVVATPQLDTAHVSQVQTIHQRRSLVELPRSKSKMKRRTQLRKKAQKRIKITRVTSRQIKAK